MKYLIIINSNFLKEQLDGRYSSLVKLNESHIDDLFQVLGKEDSRPSWTYYLFENPILQKENLISTSNV